MKIERLERHWPGDITAHYDFGPRLNIVVVPDRDRVPSVFDAAVTALSGPLADMQLSSALPSSPPTNSGSRSRYSAVMAAASGSAVR